MAIPWCSSQSLNKTAMMDDNDVDNNNNDEIDHQPQEAEAETAAADVRSSRRTQLMSLLALYDACPLRTRNNIDELVAILLENAEIDVHEMLCDQNTDDYRGLDINRDTVEEVRTIVRFFPNTISKTKTKYEMGNNYCTACHNAYVEDTFGQQRNDDT